LPRRLDHVGAQHCCAPGPHDFNLNHDLFLRLNGPSLEIVQRCDGKRTVREIVTELQHLYSKADPAKVESDILGYLKLLHDQRALDFES
jgi:Coenzyme PQQ synthesis protein D (PqqD)